MNHPREQAGEVQGFISGGGRLKEVRLLIGDSAHRLCLKAGELDKPKRRKRRSRQTIRDDHAGAIQKFYREVAWQLWESEGCHGALLASMSVKLLLNPVQDDWKEFSIAL